MELQGRTVSRRGWIALALLVVVVAVQSRLIADGSVEPVSLYTVEIGLMTLYCVWKGIVQPRRAN
ncbi:hypothetical protein SAMN05216559_0452 [Halomicrobium zhouii]|uniref:Uncharacterized protein n=1 Tax=Halomicrobium zhouii TaxID=767519 RepID=A0A1I6KAD6_9EURY|nr:hypothetical protein [Halomicrobium zhouii]SFR88169.1 hypothetical protein SAMN05216559_0452 [Halomicrobium zhouii]